MNVQGDGADAVVVVVVVDGSAAAPATSIVARTER